MSSRGEGFTINRKHSALLLCLSLSLFLVACTTVKEESFRNVQLRNGLYCIKNFDDPFSGNIIDRFDDGQMSLKMEVLAGKKNGTVTTWYENGQKREARQYSNGTKQGAWVRYYKSGQLQLEAQFANSVLTGVVRTYHTDGQPRFEAHFKNGLLNGKFREWYFTGELKIEETFTNGVRENKGRAYDATGKMLAAPDLGFCLVNLRLFYFLALIEGMSRQNGISQEPEVQVKPEHFKRKGYLSVVPRCLLMGEYTISSDTKNDSHVTCSYHKNSSDYQKDE